MTRKNKYYIRFHISEKKFREIVRYFSQDLLADDIASLSVISRQSVNKILKKIRQRIADYCLSESLFSGKVEVDES